MGRTDHTGGRVAGLRYGLLGLPLAFVALPLYVHLPQVYASRHGMPLATLGLVLLGARLLDAVTDPWLGRLSDQWHAHAPRRLLNVCGLAAMALLLGMTLLFFPPWPHPEHPGVLLATLVFTCLSFSLLSIAHQSWGARLGGDEAQRARIVAWREGLGLVGVVLASVLPGWAGWEAWLATFALALSAGWLAWRSSPAPAPGPGHEHTGAAEGWRQTLHPWRSARYRRLMAVFVLSGLASAVPATLVLFFIQDRLGTPALEPVFLATYFVAAAASMPLWMRTVTQWGLARSWLLGMLLSVCVFAWAASLGTNDAVAFGWICALSGLALGSDLALPGAMLAGLIAERGDRGWREGTYFGWWNLASKMNLALAAGLALPLLDVLGYRPGARSAPALQALSLSYAVLPCALKLLASGLLYLAFVRARPVTPSSLAEAS
jgi:Na+/melibiose symporter-like transporter